MGRYSSWWSRLLIIGIVAAVITPVGIYAVPQLTPTLNTMEFYQDPSNTEVRDMIFIASDADLNGKWTWCVNRLDIAFKNPLDKTLSIPKSDVSVKYFGGRLGDGYIADQYTIDPYETKIVSMYLKTYNVGQQAELFSRFLKAQFWGQDLTLNVDINAYVLINGILDEPLIGLKFPMTIKNPLPFGLHGWAPIIQSITTGVVQNNQPVTITFNASDPGAGISNRVYLYYRLNGIGNWDNKSVYDGVVQVNNPYWTDTFMGLSQAKPFPIPSSYPDSPVTFTANLPAQAAGTKVEYYIYIEDWAGNWQHEKQANYVDSDVMTYTVTSGTIGANTTTYDASWEDPFIIRYLDYLDTHGTNLQHYLYTLGIDMLGLLPLINTFSETLFSLNVDMDYILALLTTDFIKSLRVMADSGVPPGIMMKILGDLFGFTFDDMVGYILPRIWFPFPGDNNASALADKILKGEDITPAQKANLEDQFNAIGISAQDMIDYINPSGLIGSNTEEFRNILTLQLDLSVAVIRFQGTIIRDWNYNTAPGSTVYEKWLDLIRTGNATNGHWAAANLILLSSHASNPPAFPQQNFVELLNTQLTVTPEAFPANDLYPYTHQLVSLVMLLCLGVVSYLVLKREILIHRKVERGLAAKKKMQQKAVFDKDAKNKAQSKYL